jgi:2-succinyl-5-enolpyruvyl-6-hydroxy-3-cyclohexene-1-carboxylate synthase
LPEFEALFATPQRVDVVAVARAHNIDAERVARVTEVAKLVADGSDAPRVLVVPVDRVAARAQHRRMWEAVATALR